LRFLIGKNRYNYSNLRNNEILINRYKELEQNIENFKYYSGKQLELLSGKEIEVYYKDRPIPLFFEIKNPDRSKDNWQVKFGGLTINKSYIEVKEAYCIRYVNRSQHIAGQINRICESLKCV
jgi:hypothetical protein